MSHALRIKIVQLFLKEAACDALLVDDPINLYYLTGMHLSEGKLLVCAKQSYLMVDSRYFELCKKQCSIPVLLASAHTFSDFLSHDGRFIETLAFNNEMSYKNYLQLQACLEDIIKKSETQRNLILKALENPIKILREIKDKEEIELLRQAAELGSQGFDFVCTLLKLGITEEEVANELEIFWKKRAAKGLAFAPIIAFGANGSMPHYRAGKAQLKKGDSVLIDIGVNLQNYHSDMTRVVFFGEPDARILEIYEIVKQAQSAALKLCKPGTLIGDLDKAAREIIAEKGYGEQFTHSLGHGVGLEVHELPVLRNTATYREVALQAGMVITIEPGIYLPEIGGVRLEDTVVITSEGHENLTRRSLDIMIL